MILRTLGWGVVDSLWQATFIAGVTALVLALLKDSLTRVRYVVAACSLGLMAAAPVVTAFAGLRPLRLAVGPRVMTTVDAVVDIPALVWIASMLVPIAGAVWILGLIVCLCKVVDQVRRARRLQRRPGREADAATRTVAAGLASRMALRSSVAVRISADATVPMTLGWRKPIVLLPEWIATRLRPGELQLILAHELAHVRRRDYLANLAQIVMEALLFHHPAARWISGRIRTEREYCCDDEAIAIGRDAAGYARALASLEDARADCLPAVAAGSGTLLDRIQRIAGQPRPMLTPARGALVMVVSTAVAAAILAVALLVPPGLPFGAKLRMRRPAPPGSQPIATLPRDGSLPSKSR